MNRRRQRSVRGRPAGRERVVVGAAAGSHGPHARRLARGGTGPAGGSRCPTDGGLVPRGPARPADHDNRPPRAHRRARDVRRTAPCPPRVSRPARVRIPPASDHRSGRGDSDDRDTAEPPQAPADGRDERSAGHGTAAMGQGAGGSGGRPRSARVPGQCQAPDVRRGPGPARGHPDAASLQHHRRTRCGDRRPRRPGDPWVPGPSGGSRARAQPQAVTRIPCTDGNGSRHEPAVTDWPHGSCQELTASATCRPADRTTSGRRPGASRARAGRR